MSESPTRYKESGAVPLCLAVASVVLSVAGILLGLDALAGPAGFSGRWALPQDAYSFASKDAGTSSLLASPVIEASALLDSAPMFVPGPWNAAGRIGSPRSGAFPSEPTVFGEYIPEIQLDAAVLAVQGNQLLGVKDALVESVRSRLDPVQGFPGMGQEGHPSTGVPVEDVCRLRFGHLETGRTWERTLPLPVGTEAEGHLWEPLVFYAATGALGLTAMPSTVSTSGIEKLDAALAQLVLDTAIALQLPSGSYRIVAGP